MTRPRGPIYPRLPAVGAGIALAAALIGFRLVWLGASQAQGKAAATPRSTIEPQRGSLWDRRGNLLAVDRLVYGVGIAANQVRDPDALTAAAPLLGLQPEELSARLKAANRPWLPLSVQLSHESAQALARLGPTGLYTIPLRRRAYPLGPTTAHVTGFVNLDGQAFFGVEAYYDAELSGRPGTLAGHGGTEPRAYRPPQDGIDLVLSIDTTIQVAAAEALAEAMEQEQAEGGTVLVLEPASGAILASVSLPSYDPNDVSTADPKALADPAVAAVYEPGSVVKAFTMAGALDSGVVNADSTYEDTGSVQVAGLTISNWDHLAHGHTTMTQLLQLSLNVGAVHLAQALGPERFYSYLTAFGFGSPTGVDLAEEVAGILHQPREANWYPGNLATNSFGQGMAATPLQVAAAFAALANDGLLMAPYVVEARIDPDGTVIPVQPRPVRQVVAPGTARAVRQMLEEVVLGRVTRAAIPGYSIGGKTGTSQIPGDGGYLDQVTIASFVGFLPVEQPRAVILVKVDRPRSHRGSEAAAPVFRRVAQAVIEALDLPPDRPPPGEAAPW